MAGKKTGPKTNAKSRACKDHLGQEFVSEAAMCRYYNITPVLFTNRRRSGWDLKKSLTEPKRRGPGKPCTDHLGNQFPSQAAMFKHYGTNYTVYHYRIKTMGMSQKDALTRPIGDTDLAGAHACADHLGNQFPSKKAMCDYWRIPRTVYFLRKKAGLSLQECLAPVQKDGRQKARPIQDHLGNQFSGLDEMCAHWNISKANYMQNIRNGLNIQRALTERTERPEHPRDHTGAEFPSINAMCRAWGITKTTLRARLELGWTLEQILTNPENNSHLIACKDHLGNEFPSQKAMLDYWGVTHTTYKHRLSRGWDLAHALSPSSLHAQPSEDHEGRKFPCLQAMLEFWLCQTATYHHRVNKKRWSVKQTLTEPAGPNSLLYGPVIDKTLDSGWFLVHVPNGKDKSAQYILDRKNLFQMARELAMDAEIKTGALPKGMRAKHVGAGWFQVWNTEKTGPAPGLLLNPDDAWLERCLVKYGELIDSSQNTDLKGDDTKP